MAFINFYLDKPFSETIPKEELKVILQQCTTDNKPYPKHILNTRQTALYLFFTYQRGKRLKIKSNIKVLPENWDFKKGKYKSTTKGSLELNNEIAGFANQVIKAYIKLKDEKETIEEKEITELVHDLLHVPVNAPKNALSRAFFDFLLQKQQILTEGTLKEYKTIFKSLGDLQASEKQTLTFSSFNQAFFDRYEKFLVSKKNPYKPERGLLNDTIAKYCATLKSFLQWSFENGYHTNNKAFTKIKTQIKRKSKNEIVALTEEELFTLLNLDLKENTRLEKVRDLFCFGCFTGQRFSDIMRFNADDYNGIKWDFISMKTKKRVLVPFTGFIANAKPILEKYKYILPEISNQKFNEYLKEIGELAKIDSPVRIIRFSGVSEIQMRQPKYEFMSSHMARRTFVTIMLEKGVPITMVQKITQHSDIRTLLKYEGHGENALMESFKKT